MESKDKLGLGHMILDGWSGNKIGKFDYQNHTLYCLRLPLLANNRIL